MLVTSSRFIGTNVYSLQTGAPVGAISEPIIDPDKLKIVAFKLTGPLIRNAYILDINSIREYSDIGIIIDSIEELAAPEDIVIIEKLLSLNFNLIGLKVETKKGSKLGKVQDYTFMSDDFIIQQIIVRRPVVKAFMDPELTIHRREIAEITDYKIIVKDEEKTIKARSANEDFIPNFVNPFRTKEPDYAPADTEEAGE
ncbi:hypothetical protein IKE98_02465 [Candidatus Saccharibacteria bacterium]|nr:hypothetical protein [Candidatus Saccharibacteria bacterium]